MTDLLSPTTQDDLRPTLERMLRRLHEAFPDNFKAELVDGEIHLMSPTGDIPGRAAENILLSLRQYERTAGGRSRGDNQQFDVELPGRHSFSPDTSYTRASVTSSGSIKGAPDFAVEVRSSWDYGRRMERKLAAKRDDYFAAGTQVVWDVDVLREPLIRVYRADRPDTPDVFRRGEVADAEPAVPGWRFAVDELFD